MEKKSILKRVLATGMVVTMTTSLLLGIWSICISCCIKRKKIFKDKWKNNKTGENDGTEACIF